MGDLDLLVDFDGPATFDRYMGLKSYLEDLLGLKVELVTRKALRPELALRIQEEAVPVEESNGDLAAGDGRFKPTPAEIPDEVEVDYQAWQEMAWKKLSQVSRPLGPKHPPDKA